jgi:beta-1,4-mannosyl-glycoprotein beta-1,4-N-acetylglucosaminyltransferase
MKIFDTFMFFNEVEMLRCRLEELNNVVDRFIVVESYETHQGKKKPSYYLDNVHRFEPWAGSGRIVLIRAKLQKADPVAREAEQRQWTAGGLRIAGAAPEDIVLHSDVDEVPTPSAVLGLERFLWDAARHSPFVTMEQRLCCFAVDWEHPAGWRGPVAARRCHIDSFQRMRQARGPATPAMKNAGSHMSWLGGPSVQAEKLGAFMHTEDSIQGQREAIVGGEHYRQGRHVDGVKLVAVEVDHSWPGYVWRRECPKEWFRPRRGSEKP